MGWLRRTGKWAILLGLGFYLSQGFFEDQIHSRWNARFESLKAQSKSKSQEIWSNIEKLRSEAFLINEKKQIDTGSNLRLVLEVSAKGLDPLSLKAIYKNNAAFEISDAPILAKNIVELLENSLNRFSIRQQGVSFLRIKKDLSTQLEWMVLTFYQSSSPDSMVATVVDPADSIFSFSSGNSVGRNYLISDDGQILNHSQISYSGTNFGESEVFLKSISQQMLDLSHLPQPTLGVDRLPVLAAYTRIDRFPLGIVAEEVISVPNVTDYAEAGIKGFGLAMVVGIVFNFVFFRKSKKKIEEDSFADLTPLNLGDLAEHPVVPPPFKLPESVNQAMNSLQETQELKREMENHQKAIRLAKMDTELLEQYEKETLVLKDPRSIAHRFTEVAAQISGRPTLFFVFHGKLALAMLQSDAGFHYQQAPYGMSFGIDEMTHQTIKKSHERGESHRLSDYGPLKQLLKKKFGIENFEARTLFGFNHSFLGILVILHTSENSQILNENLSRMMRTTGLIYENSLS